jgi:hypothetical protein
MDPGKRKNPEARICPGWELSMNSRGTTGGTGKLALKIEKGAGASPLFLN